jgi:DNA-binding MarR family transcriptional regulator
MTSKVNPVTTSAPIATLMDAVDVTMKAWGTAFGNADLQALEIAIRIHRLGLLAAMEIDILLRPLKIHAGDADVLARLYESGQPYDLTPGQLTTQCFVTTGAMTGRIDRLERAKVVLRVKSKSDRRSHHVRLTKSGLDLAKYICSKILKNAFSEGVRSVPTADRKQLLSILREMERHVLSRQQIAKASEMQSPQSHRAKKRAKARARDGNSRPR